MYLRFSKSGTASIFVYIVFLLLYMLILPFGDEPDFSRRVYQYIIQLEYFNLSYYSDGMTIYSDCKYKHNPLNILGAYDYNSCVQRPGLAFKRAFFTFLIFLPVVIISLSVRQFQNKQFSRFFKDYSINNDAIKLSLVFPSFVYYSSLFSPEQVSLMLSILLIYTLFRAKYIYAITLLILIFMIDKGNSFVVAGILMHIVASIFIYKKAGFKKFFLLNIVLILLTYFISTEILYFIEPYSSGFINEKIVNVLVNIKTYDVSNNWPLWLRPFMTSLSYAFMTPAFSKHPLLYLFIALGLINLLIKYSYNKNFPKIDTLYTVVPISIISMLMIIVFILPGYNNAKYYIFTLPFFINSLLYYFSFKKIIIFFIFLNIIVLTDFLLFYAIGCDDCNTSPYDESIPDLF